MQYALRIVIFVVTAATAACGCATVSSTRRTNAQDDARGLTYFLPRQRLQFVATRSVVDPKAIREALDAAKKREASAKALSDAAKASLNQEEGRFKQRKCTADLANSNPTCRELGTRVEIAQADSVLASASLKEASETIRALEAKLFEAQRVSAGDECVYQYDAKLIVLPPESDPRFQFTLDIEHSLLRDDTYNLSVSPDGLLSATNVVATDRTGEILAEIAGTIAAFGVGAPGNVVMMSPLEPAAAPPKRCDELPNAFAKVFDPSESEANSALNTALNTAGFPYLITVVETCTARETCPAPEPQNINGKNGGRIYYRSARPVEVVINQIGKSNELTPINSAIVKLPQAGPIAYVPMNSSAFVKTVNNVKFENGIPTAWESERPSELLEIVRLPTKILTSMMTVPAQLLRIQVDYSTADKSIAENQMLRRDAEGRLKALNACIKAAGDDSARLAACFPSDTE